MSVPPFDTPSGAPLPEQMSAEELEALRLQYERAHKTLGQRVGELFLNREKRFQTDEWSAPVPQPKKQLRFQTEDWAKDAPAARPTKKRRFQSEDWKGEAPKPTRKLRFQTDNWKGDDAAKRPTKRVRFQTDDWHKAQQPKASSARKQPQRFQDDTWAKEATIVLPLTRREKRERAIWIGSIAALVAAALFAAYAALFSATPAPPRKAGAGSAAAVRAR